MQKSLQIMTHLYNHPKIVLVMNEFMLGSFLKIYFGIINKSHNVSHIVSRTSVYLLEQICY